MLRYSPTGALLTDAPPEKSQPTARTSGKPAYFTTALILAVWLYTLALLLAWAMLRFGGDRWWFPTVMLFGPRWIYGLPLVVLVPPALWLRRRLLAPLALGGLIVVGPMMGFCLPWARLTPAAAPPLRVLTYNVDVDAVSKPALLSLVEHSGADVVMLQECAFDARGGWPPGWEVRQAGQLVLAARYSIRRVELLRRRRPPSPWPPLDALYCEVETPSGPVGLCSIHLQTPRYGLDAVLDRDTGVDPGRSGNLAAAIQSRRWESEDVAAWLGRFAPPLVLAGDFNMPVDSAIYRHAWSQYRNAFSRAGFGFGHTKHTLIHGFLYGLRIDHVLSGPQWRPLRCWVGPDIGSDHSPVIADLQREPR